MKKIKMLLFILLVMFLMPKVYAAEGVAIESVTLDSKSDTAVIVSDATFDELALKVDLKFNDVNDFVKYKLVIKNSSSTDYELAESTSSSSYITYEYNYEDDSKVLGANSSKTMFITIKYSNAVPVAAFSEGKYTETKSITINLDDGTDEVTEVAVPSTIDGLYCYLVLLIGTLVLSVALLKVTRNKKFLVLILVSMILIPMNINAIVKLKITVESKVEISNPNEITEMIYWALQKNGSGEEEICFDVDDCMMISFDMYKLVISDNEQDGEYKGSFAGTTIFSNSDEIPWQNKSYINKVIIDGKVVPASTAYWFLDVGRSVDELSFDLNGLNTTNVTSMYGMFANSGIYSSSLTLDLRGFDTSNVTNMSHLFYYTGANSETFNLDISTWNTSKVEDMDGMFMKTGISADENARNILLPKTNGNGINNTSSIIYGIDDSVYADINEVPISTNPSPNPA